jgi:hypothetical protein
MPTGYTAKVNDGSITDLKSYALICARAFGASLTSATTQAATSPRL